MNSLANWASGRLDPINLKLGDRSPISMRVSEPKMRRELAREPGCSGSRVAGGERAGRRAEAGVFALLIAAVSGVAAQLVVLALSRQPSATLALSEPVATSFSRPDIVDRNGRLLATDLEAPSIYADPGVVLDRDEVVEKL